MKCRSYLNLALIYDQRGDTNDGCRYYKMAIQLASEHKLKETLHRCQNSLALFYQKFGHYTRALPLLNDAIATVRSLKNKVFECEYLMAKGHLMLLMNNCSAARKSFRDAVRSKSPVDEDRQKAEQKYQTATLICKAMKLLQKLESADHLVADGAVGEVEAEVKSSRAKFQKLVQVYEKLGDLLSDAEAFGPAVKHYKRQLEVATEAQASAGSIARIYVSIAQTLFDDKEYEEALLFFRKEHEVRKGNPVEETRTTLKIIEISIAMKKEAAHIHELYESALLRFSSDEHCLKKILEDYALYLDQELEIEKAGEIRRKLQQLDHADKRHNGDKEDEQEDGSEQGDGEDRHEDESDSLRLTDVSSPSSSSDSEDEERGGTRYLKDSEGRPKRLRTKKIKTNEVGETPLHRACIEGDLGRVSKLLAANHPINPRDHCGWLPIHEAANHDYPDIVSLLVDAGADVNDPGGDKCGGTTPLHDACNNGHVQVIEVLVQKGADVCMFDQDSNTPVDCLRNWRNRVPELDEDAAHAFQQTVQLLEQKMASAGFDLEAERKRPVVHLSPDKDTRRNRAVKHSRRRVKHDSPPDTPSPRKKKSRKLDRDVDFDDPQVARGEYKAAIKSLRRTRDPGVDFDEEKEESRTNDAPLIDACDRLDVDDWLVDDVAKERKASHRELYESRLLPKKSISRRAHAAADWTRGQRSEATSGRSHSTESTSVREEQGPDAGSSEVIEVEDMAEERAVSSREVNALSHPADERVNSGEQKRQQLLISVRIEDKTFLIRVPDHKKLVSWLTQETQSRYFHLVKKKPLVYLQTPDGAILSPDDLIIDVITGKEVKACIQSFESLPLDVRYQENCKLAGMSALPDVEQLVRDCERNGLLNLGHVLVFGAQEKALLDSIAGSRRLVSVDLSFRNLATGEQTLLAWFRDALPQLRELRLSGCGISTQDLAILADSSLPISLLDLSYNPLHDDSLPVLCRLLQSMHSLSALYLIACDFSPNMPKHPDLAHVVSTHVTLRQVFIDQSVAKHVTAADLEARFGNRLQLQKWKKLLPVSGL